MKFLIIFPSGVIMSMCRTGKHNVTAFEKNFQVVHTFFLYVICFSVCIGGLFDTLSLIGRMVIFLPLCQSR